MGSIRIPVEGELVPDPDAASDVYNYCTTARPSLAPKGKPAAGANFAGEDLYYRLQNFLQKHVRNSCKVWRVLALPQSYSCLDSDESDGRLLAQFL